jgi:spiro-SPASM protein
MNIVAAVFADFVETFLGTPSRLNAPLHDRPVLAHTLARLLRVADVSARALVVRPRDTEAARAAVAAAGLTEAVEVLPIDDAARPRRELLRAGRRAHPAGWRGSALGTSWFDEYVEPLAVGRVIDHYRCDAVLCLDGHQAAFDTAIAAGMLRHQRERASEAQLTYTQAPPGLAGIVLCREAVRTLLEADMPVGLHFAYRPEAPRGELYNRPPCYHIDPTIVHTAARLTADTRGGLERLAAAFAALGPDADAAALCALAREPALARGAVPAEVEIELTTADPLPETTLRPRGPRVPRRELLDVARVGELAAELADWEDRLVVLGGHGDPLLHPRFGEVCRAIQAAGPVGLAVVTPLVALSDAAFEALFDAPVDLLQVRLDAHSAETYARVHGRDAFAHVVGNVRRILAARRERVRPRPVVVPSMVRSAATIEEMENFYDAWIRETGWAVIEGHDTFAGLLPDDPLMHVGPPMRGPCRRIERRLMLLADGRVPTCSQDVAGVTSLGDWRREGLGELWSGGALAALRAAHGRMELGEHPLCGRCREWFRS